MAASRIPTVVSNPWTKLRDYTPARIALGRSGTSLPTKPHLDFQLAHARARKAVHHDLDIETLGKDLAAQGRDVIVAHSAAADRPTYLQRPDKGRMLDEASREALIALPKPAEPYDLAFVIGDGLSALAIEENAARFLATLMPQIERAGSRVAPIVVVKEARVAVGDEIGEILGAAMVVVLIGERPGLSSPDSLGIYMTLNPRRGLTDEARNCISNVRKEGLSYAGAAHKLWFLMSEARRRNISGVNLKDEAEDLPQAVGHSQKNFLIDTD
ncbi:ethanolamine ammonia-lyase [Hyphomicrobium methylovorum]|uniref:ethanolamine ammonia-lyase subunit EutC n=1 Tax=Hyphomicrobium methylovorum TaxID=84 RepID=UPI0015E6FD9A|nr:ethanolamine ammonia-lyase subunit EutC [Hyphomicrobium methylovorum]MBA2127235.1 ethanolamine ammonia-lyase [Hyphomicrobium methylovorum]